MTELEQQLTNALTALSKQYEAEMEQQAEWVGELQEQVQRLEESVKDLKPQLGRTEASAKDLKQQVELLRRDYKEIAECCAGCERDLEAAAAGAGTAARAGARLWPQPLGLSSRFASGGRGGRLAGVREQVHVGGDHLGTGGCADRLSELEFIDGGTRCCRNWPGATILRSLARRIWS